MTSLGSDFPVPSHMMRYALQGRAPFEWIGRGRVCYSATSYTPVATAGTSEIVDQLNAHLAGIDAALAALGGPGTYPDAWETANGTDAFDTADLVEQWDIASV